MPAADLAERTFYEPGQQNSDSPLRRSVVRHGSAGMRVKLAEGPTTNLTIVVTPKSRMEVRISSIALCRASSTDRDGPVAVILDSQNAKQSHPSPQMPFSPRTQRCAP